MAAVLAATGWYLYARVDSHLAAALDRQLRVRAHDLAQVVERSEAPLSAAGRIPGVERGETYVQLLDGGGRVVDSTPPLGGGSVLSAAELRDARSRAVFADRSSVPGLDEPSRLLATPVERDGKRLILLVGVTAADRAETVSSLRTELLIAGPIALALASLLGYFLAGLSLKPVEAMRRRAATISAERPGERLPVPPTGDELQRLGETLNAMLSRLEEALERERNFVADAGHELRSPLALLRTELELALRYEEMPDELRDAVRASSDEVHRLAQLADDLLLIAQTDRGQLPLRVETLDASELLDAVVRRFEWRADEAGRPVRAATAHGVRVEGDRIRLEQALVNLVDNALRHGSGPVTLFAARDDGMVELHVRDEGEGFPPEFLERAFERFSRPDEARTRGGSGLGLSIVRTIAESHGGTAHAANRESGGADVWVEVPVPSRP
jgi:heavy metal sensor kinase